MTKFKVNNKLSIADRVNLKFFNHIKSKGIIGVENASPMVTTPNINLPLGALTYIRPQAIEVLTAPRMAERFAKPQQNGRWGDESINIKIKEYTGKVAPDDGGTSDGLQVKTNYENALRGVYYFHTGWLATDIQEARVGAMKENYRADQVNASMTTIAIARNNYFFKGVETKSNQNPIYGLLNDPNLPPYETVSQVGEGSSASTYWSNKTAQQIHNDVVAAVGSVMSRSAGKAEEAIGRGAHWSVGIATGSYMLLDQKNEFGKSAKTMLEETFKDKIDIFPVPQFNSADSDSDVFYVALMSDEVPTILNSYVELARAYPMFIQDSQVSQKISSATSGCIVQYPFFISRFNGIGKSPKLS